MSCFNRSKDNIALEIFHTSNALKVPYLPVIKHPFFAIEVLNYGILFLAANFVR